MPFVITFAILTCWGLLQALLKNDWTMAIRYPLSILWASGDAIYSEKFGYIYAGPLWFLIALFWIREFFYYGAGWIQCKCRKCKDECVLVGSFVVSIIAVLLHKVFDTVPWSVFQGLACIEFYAIGWYFHRHKIQWWLKLICIICWPIAIFFGGLELSSCAYECYPLDVLGACGAVLVIYQICLWVMMLVQKIKSSVYVTEKTLVQWIGVNSLVVLCVHTFDIQSSAIYSVLCRLPFEIHQEWLVAIRMALAVGISVLITQIREIVKN